MVKFGNEWKGLRFEHPEFALALRVWKITVFEIAWLKGFYLAFCLGGFWLEFQK